MMLLTGQYYIDKLNRVVLPSCNAKGRSLSLLQFFSRKHEGSVFSFTLLWTAVISTLLQTFIFCRSLVNMSVHNVSTLTEG